jgi:hypothetical protein
MYSPLCKSSEMDVLGMSTNVLKLFRSGFGRLGA